MRITFLILIVLTRFLIGCANSNKSPLPPHFEECDNVIQIYVPYDTIFARYDPGASNYVLAFPTYVKSSMDSISIIEFGCYFEHNGSWERKSSNGKGYFGSREFEKWYECPNSILERNVRYRDGFNWLWRTKELTGKVQTVMLYFIGKDKEGKTHCGTKKLVGVEAIKPR